MHILTLFLFVVAFIMLIILAFAIFGEKSKATSVVFCSSVIGILLCIMMVLLFALVSKPRYRYEQYELLAFTKVGNGHAYHYIDEYGNSHQDLILDEDLDVKPLADGEDPYVEVAYNTGYYEFWFFFFEGGGGGISRQTFYAAPMEAIELRG